MSVVSRSRMEGKPAETARCLFCGVVGLWWTCGCEWSQKIAAGKLPRPRTVIRGGVPIIEMCEELRRAARLAGVITREYRGEAGEGPVTEGSGLREAAEVSVTSVTDKLAVPDNVPVTDNVPVSAICVVCGKGFVPLRSSARYCSGACRVRAQRRK
jgi:hypothetical protein